MHMSPISSLPVAKTHLTPPNNVAANATYFYGAADDPATGKKCELPSLLRGSEGSEWNTVYAGEIGQLAQGVDSRIAGTKTIHFTPPRC